MGCGCGVTNLRGATCPGYLWLNPVPMLAGAALGSCPHGPIPLPLAFLIWGGGGQSRVTLPPHFESREGALGPLF